MGEDGTQVFCQHQAIIRFSRLEELLDAERRLDALEAAGVDNWDGYPIAMATLEAGDV